MFRVEPYDDPAVAEAIYVEAGWQRVAGEIPRRLAHPGSAHFAAREGEETVGVASVTVYPRGAGYDRLAAREEVAAPGAALAWIAGMTVRETWRGRGVGRALLAACREHAEQAGAPVVALDATAAGQRLYARAGFREEGSAARWARTAAPEPAPGPAPDLAVYPVGVNDAMEVLVFDADRFGASRSAVVADVIARSRGAALAAYARRDGAMVGYVAADEHEIGPLVADTPAAAHLLLAAALSAGAPAFARLGPRNPQAAEIFGDAGFRPTGETCLRMAAGGPLPGRNEAIYAIRGWGWG